MRLIKRKGDCHLLEINEYWSVLFSYETPVLAYDGRDVFITEKYWSRTTSKHINAFMKDIGAIGYHSEKQEWFDKLPFG